jgi:hypothetical protein
MLSWSVTRGLCNLIPQKEFREDHTRILRKNSYKDKIRFEHDARKRLLSLFLRENKRLNEISNVLRLAEHLTHEMVNDVNFVKY